MRLLKNSFRLQNTDLRWYRDKYLTAIFIVCFLVAMSFLWQWPPPHQDFVRGAKFLGVAVVCLLVSPQRLIILTGGLSFIAVRGVIGLILYHSVAAIVVGLVAAAIVYLLVVRREDLLNPPYKINDYSYAELGIDCAILGSLLWLYVRFIR